MKYATLIFFIFISMMAWKYGNVGYAALIMIIGYPFAWAWIKHKWLEQ